MSLNQFGGSWTEAKAQVFVKYVSSYLHILKRKGFELVYFDGFAGSGEIELADGSVEDSIALRVLTLEHDSEFDHYWLVEKDEQKLNRLIEIAKGKVSDLRFKKIYYKSVDCNVALKSLSGYLSSPERKKFRTLALIDPFGMSLDYESFSGFNKIECDFWFLIPTGVGANRLLTKDGKISGPWMKKLESFFGTSEEEIRDHFYKKVEVNTLFSEQETLIFKEQDSIQKCGKLYSTMLGKVFKHVSSPFLLFNSRGNILYHFVLATNHPLGVKVANDILSKTMKYHGRQQH